MFFWNFLAISMIHWMLAIWSLVPLPFSKSRLYIWKFSVHVVLKPSLKNFEHCLGSLWNECNCLVVWTFFGIGLLWDWNENWLFPVQWSLLFPNLLACLMQPFNSIIFLNSSGGISLPPLALFFVVFPKAHLTSHSRMSDARPVTTPLWLSWSLRPFCTVLLYIFATSS